jgi:hypothetical protein
MSFVLLVESGREPTPAELAEHRVVLGVDERGRVKVVKNALGGFQIRSGMTVTTFLAVADVEGWEVDRA